MYLVDTNVISAGAPARNAVQAELVQWMDAASDVLFLSVVTAAEIETGIAKAIREGATAKAARLSDWRAAVEHLYGARILPVDLEVAHAIGRLLDRARALGHAPGWADLAIAATAKVRRLTVLTRNLRHFEPLGVPVADPFEQLPPWPERGAQ